MLWKSRCGEKGRVDDSTMKLESQWLAEEKQVQENMENMLIIWEDVEIADKFRRHKE